MLIRVNVVVWVMGNGYVSFRLMWFGLLSFGIMLFSTMSVYPNFELYIYTPSPSSSPSSNGGLKKVKCTRVREGWNLLTTTLEMSGLRQGHITLEKVSFSLYILTSTIWINFPFLIFRKFGKTFLNKNK